MIPRSFRRTKIPTLHISPKFLPPTSNTQHDDDPPSCSFMHSTHDHPTPTGLANTYLTFIFGILLTFVVFCQVGWMLGNEEDFALKMMQRALNERLDRARETVMEAGLHTNATAMSCARNVTAPPTTFYSAAGVYGCLPTVEAEIEDWKGRGLREGGVAWGFQWIIFILLFNNLIPVSLYLTLDLIRFMQAGQMKKDPELIYWRGAEQRLLNEKNHAERQKAASRSDGGKRAVEQFGGAMTLWLTEEEYIRMGTHRGTDM